MRGKTPRLPGPPPTLRGEGASPTSQNKGGREETAAPSRFPGRAVGRDAAPPPASGVRGRKEGISPGHGALPLPVAVPGMGMGLPPSGSGSRPHPHGHPQLVLWAPLRAPGSSVGPDPSNMSARTRDLRRSSSPLWSGQRLPGEVPLEAPAGQRCFPEGGTSPGAP